MKSNPAYQIKYNERKYLQKITNYSSTLQFTPDVCKKGFRSHLPSKEKEAVAAPSLTWSSSSSLRSNCLLPISCIILVKRKQGVMDEGQSFRQEGRSKRIVQSSAAIPPLRFKIFTLQTLPQIEDGFMEGISRGLFF